MDLRVIVVDGERDRGDAVRAGLERDGLTVTAMLDAGPGLADRLAGLAADAVIAIVDRPGRDTFDEIGRLCLEQRRPVLVFARDDSPETIRAAAAADVAAYVVDGLASTRVRPMVEFAIANFERVAGLRDELAKTRTTLAERKMVERAKGILMKRRGVDEDEAYRLMRRMAMDGKRRLVDVAARIIEAADLLG